MKQCAIISYKDGIYELPHELPIELRLVSRCRLGTHRPNGTENNGASSISPLQVQSPMPRPTNGSLKAIIEGIVYIQGE